MSKGQAYSPNGQDEEESYRQQLGLKKILYKYQHQNEQLKTQIKALTERLTDILNKKEEQAPQEQKHIDAADQYRLSLLKQELKKLFAQIEKITMEIKSHKELLNEFQELRCVQLENKVKNEQKQIEEYKGKMQKYEKMQKMKKFALQSNDLRNSSLRINTHSEKMRQIETQLDQTRKNIRELQKFRDTHDKNEIKRQHYVIGINQQTRKISHLGKQGKEGKDSRQKQQQNGKKGVWNMNYNEQNYEKIRTELNDLKKQKQRIFQSLKNEYVVLKSRYTELSVQCQQLNKSIHLPMIDYPRTKKQNKKEKEKAIIQLKDSIDKSRVRTPPKMLNIGPKEFQRNNDKNYSPKKLRKIQWESNQHRTNGIQWNDGHLRSPITGINLWFDSSLIGIQFLHRLGQSTQHLHLTSKNISPVQYRLNGNDYLENVVLWISDNQIVGIQLASKTGRQDGFGNKGKGRKFDFNIKDPQKPVFSYGKFRIVNNVSQIIKFGFQAV